MPKQNSLMTGKPARLAVLAKHSSVALLLAAILGACSATEGLIDKVSGKDDNVVLPGKRESVLNRPGDALQVAKEPVVIPVATTNTSWAQPGGVPSNVLQNLSLNRKLSRVFAVNAGAGSDKHGRLTAVPIVVGGRVFVMDSQAGVRAFSATSGARIWAVTLVPKGRDGEGAYGGGLASDGAQIFATTAFGEVVSLSTATGAVNWRVKVPGPVKTAPIVANGQVFFVTTSGLAMALSTSSGSVLWQAQGEAATASTISNTSPAVSGGLVIVPHTSGDLDALSVSGGQRYWTANLASSSAATSVANLNAIAGRPVVASGQVFAVSNGGRLASFALKSGAEIWSRNFPGNQTPWVSGEYVFMISQRDRMVAVSRKTGRVKWITDIPGRGIWAGPVMGGGRLIAVSNKGALISISPQTGQVINTIEAGDAFYITPVIAANTVYLLDDSASLIALR